MRTSFSLHKTQQSATMLQGLLTQLLSCVSSKISSLEDNVSCYSITQGMACEASAHTTLLQAIHTNYKKIKMYSKCHACLMKSCILKELSCIPCTTLCWCPHVWCPGISYRKDLVLAVHKQCSPNSNPASAILQATLLSAFKFRIWFQFYSDKFKVNMKLVQQPTDQLMI